MTEAQITSLDTGIAPLREEGQPRHRIPVLMAGFGKMGLLVAEAVERDGDFELFSVGFTSERHEGEHRQIGDTNVLLFTPRRDRFPYWKYYLKEGTIVVDYSTVDSVLTNAEFYIAHRLPFVMGTSTGDKERLQRITEMVATSDISAVIAPNMDPQIVRRQMEIDEMAAASPGIFEGAAVFIRESHQSTKEGDSGTARAFREQLEGYGAHMGTGIEKIRDTERQRKLGVPEKHLDWHAYHWVGVTNKGGSLIVAFETKVHGGDAYAEGALMAIRFLVRQMRDGTRGQVFSMADVLRAQGEQQL